MLCHCSIPFEYNFGLPKGHLFFLPQNGKPAWVSCETVEGSNIVSMTEDPKEWLLDEKMRTMHLWLLGESEKPERAQTAYLDPATLSLSGLVSHSKFTRLSLFLEIDNIDEIKGDPHDETFITKCADLIEDFVYRYLLYYPRAGIGLFAKTQSLVAAVFVTDQYKFQGDKLILHNPTEFSYVTHLNIAKREKGFRSLLMNDVDDIDGFSKSLVTRQKVSEHEKMLLRSRELISLSKDYNLAIVVAETAFEVAIRQFLTETCILKKISKLQAKGKNSPLIPYMKAIEGGRINSELLHYVNFIVRQHKKLKGCNVKADKENSNWYHKSYVKRNNIVHKGHSDYGQTDATDALTSVALYLDHIKHLLQISIFS